MSYITVESANAWLEKTKLSLTVLDSELEASISSQVLAEIAQIYDVSSWLNTSTTPSLVSKIIAMKYAAWYIQRTYSEDLPSNDYAELLLAEADRLIQGITSEALILSDTNITIVPSAALVGEGPSFYPNDAAIDDDPRFTMGSIW